MARRARPGTHEHWPLPKVSQACVPGFRALGLRPRPGMTRILDLCSGQEIDAGEEPGPGDQDGAERSGQPGAPGRVLLHRHDGPQGQHPTDIAGADDEHHLARPTDGTPPPWCRSYSSIWTPRWRGLDHREAV